MLIGMQAIDSEDTLLGRLKMSPLLLEGQAYPFTWKIKKGESRNISRDQVQAVGYFVPLKLEQAQQTQQTCPTCKGPLTYISQYQRWYCYTCKNTHDAYSWISFTCWKLSFTCCVRVVTSFVLFKKHWNVKLIYGWVGGGIAGTEVTAVEVAFIAKIIMIAAIRSAKRQVAWVNWCGANHVPSATRE